jgi:predicted nucleic acid-binding protein
MRLVVADTGPLNYLLLIDAIELLPKLFETVFTPEAVRPNC